VPDNDNLTPTVLLDEHRGMASQKATDARRLLSEVEADQAALRQKRAELEKFLFAAPAATWQDAARKALYLLRLFADAPELQDNRLRQLIDDATADFDRLMTESAGTEA